MKKSVAVLLLVWCAAVLAVAQVSFTNESKIQFASDAAEKADAGFDYLQNQFDISGEFEKFSFNGRLRLRLLPMGDRLFSDGATLVTGFSRFPTDDSWIRANAYVRPVKGLELAFGTNIDYSLGSGSNWGDYEMNDFESGDFEHTLYVDYFGKNDWAKNGFAVKYAVAGFEIGVAVPAYDFDANNDIKLALTKTTFALKYSLDGVFNVGAAYFADFKKDSMQTVAANFALDVIESVPFNIFADYSTSDSISNTEILNIGFNVPISLGALSIEPEFAYRVLLGSHYKDVGYKNPWFAAALVSYEFEKITPMLWFSYSSGYNNGEKFRIDIKPEIQWVTKYGTLGAAFDLILKKNPVANARAIYVGWELPVSWTISY